ncbi:MAG: hypothetical protein OJJ54_03970 [Pseudonocardia sp.]|nr:hypothetical protein [Pseudonocardia sp.]
MTAVPSAGLAARMVKAELRRTLSVRMWWALLIPVVLLSLSINVFGGVFSSSLSGVGGETPGVLLASLAYSLSLGSVFAAVHGAVQSSGEFRHRTITTTYLTGGRVPVLLARSGVAAAVGALYALGSVAFGLLAGLLGQGSATFPSAGPLLGLIGTGIAVCALWAVLGVAVGTLMTNQAGAVVLLLVYVLAIENVLSLILKSGSGSGLDAGPPAIARITSYLPANAGDVALYDIPAVVLAGPRYGRDAVESLAGVASPPPGWASLVVLALWAGAGIAAAWVVGERRDIT